MANIKLKHKHKQAKKSPKLNKFQFFLQQSFLSSPEGAKYSKGYGYEDVNGYGQLWKSERGGYVYNCPLGVPSSLQRDDFSPPGSRSPRIPMAKKYKALYEEAEKGYIPNGLLLATFQRRMKERPVVYSENETGEGYMFHGLIKGCPDYNRILEEKITARSARLINNYEAFYFLTVTYAQNLHGLNIPEAWQIFNMQLGSLMHSIQRKYNGGYVCVLESTFRGYPHAHIILGLPSTPDIKHKRLSPGKVVKYGRLFGFLKKRMPSPVFKLQVADIKGLKNYLTKYVSKGLDKLIDNKKTGQSTLSKDEKKALLSCMCPVLASVRQFRSSVRDGQKKTVLDDFIDPGHRERLEMASKMGIWDSSASAVLISFLNNLTVNCRAHAWAIFNSSGKEAYKKFMGYYESSNYDQIRDFKRSSYPLGCPGCVITDFLDKISGKPRENIQPIVIGRVNNQPVLKDTSVRISEIYALDAGLPNGYYENLSEVDKKDLFSQGIVVNIDHVEIDEKFIERRKEK
jgi:hypothetical protein